MCRIRTFTRTIHVLAIVHVLALGLVLVLGLRQELGRVLGLLLVFVFVRNLLKDTKNDILSTSSCTRIAIDANDSLSHMTFSGKMPAGCDLYAMDRTALSHNEFVYGLFLSLWREAGGEFFGGWRVARAPEALALAHLLARLDVESYRGSTMGPGHPICWCHEIGRGRALYTGGGHTDESFQEPLFRAHLLGAIRWAAGVTPSTAAREDEDR